MTMRGVGALMALGGVLLLAAVLGSCAPEMRPASVVVVTPRPTPFPDGWTYVPR